MSVDFSPYVNLRIYDKDPGELYLTAVELLQMNVPQLSVRPGTIEDGMIQAFSFLTTIAINHINSLPNRLAEGLATFMGVGRAEATFASIPVRITAFDYVGGDLEAGTLLEHSFIAGGQTYREYYELPNGITIDAVTPDLNANPPTPLPYTDTVATALVTGERRTIAEGQTLTIMSSQQVSDVAVAQTGFFQGSVGESDAAYLARFSTFLQSMTSTSSTAKQIESFVLANYDFVGRAKAYDLTNGLSNRLVGAADAPGFVTLYVYGNDEPVSEFDRIRIYEEVRDRLLGGLVLCVEGFDIVPVTLDTTVKVSKFADLSSVASSIKTLIGTYLSPMEFSLTDPAIRKNNLLSQLSSIPYVMRVDELSFTCDNATTTVAGDEVFDKKGTLPRLLPGDITMNVSFA